MARKNVMGPLLSCCVGGEMLRIQQGAPNPLLEL